MKISDGNTDSSILNYYPETKKKFQNAFGSFKNSHYSITPASLILLGDHTHYNDGLLLSVALNNYSTVIIRKRTDKKIIIIDAATNEELEFSLGEYPENNTVNFKYIVSLLKTINDEKTIRYGFECVFNAAIPDCIGLGKITSLQISFAFALKKAFGIAILTEEMLTLIRKNELEILGKIANYAHLYTAKFQKENKISYMDLRTLSHKTIAIKDDEFDLVVFDTMEKIKEPRKTCNERIEECEIGVKGLRLYIWGIKNLRDVGLDFLMKHYHMLPRRIFNRILYNVKERGRAEDAVKHLKKHSYEEFGKCITDSHWNLSNEYELSCDKCDFIVESASKLDCELGSKMISCTSVRGTFHIVKKNCANDFIRNITNQYSEKYNEHLKSYTFHLSESIKRIVTDEIEILAD